jgi:glycosyltransferase involved in cell wall biosynthesis
MNNEIVSKIGKDVMNELFRGDLSVDGIKNGHQTNNLPEILFITSYPPRECGIATYSQDLLKALNNKFNNSFSLTVCALESGNSNLSYPDEVKYVLNTNDSQKYIELAEAINNDKNLQFVFIQHEFGFFQHRAEDDFLQFLYTLIKPITIVFHTVLPKPDEAFKAKVKYIASSCESIVVMTRNSAKILKDDYGVPAEMITVIPHGTHLVQHLNKDLLKEKYRLAGRKIVSTFGLLSSGKGIETTLDSLPSIISMNPDIAFLIIGKTHPGVAEFEGEKYRNMLEAKVEELKLQDHVIFVNHYLPLQDLLEYLQLTDIYLFTSKDPNQAVSGTFSYAMSCACPIISTPFPHAKEVLRKDAGIIVDFQNTQQLADGVNLLLNDEPLRTAFSSSTLQRIVPTAWENSAIAHAQLIRKIAGHNYRATSLSVKPGHPLRNSEFHNGELALQYRLPEINLEHVRRMTTDFGIIQFSKINQPDLDSGYTLDDNARALIAICMHYELTGDQEDLRYIGIYLDFIKFCLQPGGNFLNYVDGNQHYTEQNEQTNLSDSNGRAVWALGYLISRRMLLPAEFVSVAESILNQTLPYLEMMHSTRSMAFAIKGLYYSNLANKSEVSSMLIRKLANRLVSMYEFESGKNWKWFESYMTYANSLLPEAMLCAWLDSGDNNYKRVAKDSFDFLLSLTFSGRGIKVISNKNWLHKGNEAELLIEGGEQPIDVAYCILAMSTFLDVFREMNYSDKMATAFDWFLGDNLLNQIIYNPCTGGCYDGMEEDHVNLNQGAESTLSYLMARLTIEKHLRHVHDIIPDLDLNLAENMEAV